MFTNSRAKAHMLNRPDMCEPVNTIHPAMDLESVDLPHFHGTAPALRKTSRLIAMHKIGGDPVPGGAPSLPGGVLG